MEYGAQRTLQSDLVTEVSSEKLWICTNYAALEHLKMGDVLCKKLAWENALQFHAWPRYPRGVDQEAILPGQPTSSNVIKTRKQRYIYML